jgi:NADH-quinone oxidoreductase subunit L
MLKYLFFVPLLPLIGAILNGLLGRSLKLSERTIALIACGTTALSCALALACIYDYATHHAPAIYVDPHYAYTWIAGGDAQLTLGRLAGTLRSFRVEWAYQMDPLSAVMTFIVTFVGFLIHVFATGYMRGEAGYYRFFSFLNLFMFMMLVLVLGSNLPMMFVGWEGVGLCSYLLIGYYFDREEAASASKKAFITNRVGDMGFMLGMFGVFALFGTLNFADLSRIFASGEVARYVNVEHFGEWGLLSWIALGLFIGACGKSAQIPLYVWLPDAMAGPTPVSALIHAATMVTAGVYMVTRVNYLFQAAPSVMFVVAVVGAATAIFAATIGITQNDIKRVLAYSTVSQLGYMFLACGVGAFIAGIFHVFTHAFFKAQLFLGSGSIIHGMHHEQDMRRMGGLKKYMPITHWTMLAAWLAICGIIPFAGFFSKDEILWKTFNVSVFPNYAGKILYLVGLITAGCTALYMTRLMAMTFWTRERTGFQAHADKRDGTLLSATSDAHGFAGHHGAEAKGGEAQDHGQGAHGQASAVTPHSSPKSMAIPLVILAFGSAIAGLVGIPHALGGKLGIHNYFEEWLKPVIVEARPSPAVATASSHGGGGEIAAAAQPGAGEAHGAESVQLELSLMALSVVIALAGIFLARFIYLRRPVIADRAQKALGGVPYRLSLNKYFVDEMYAVFPIGAMLSLTRALMGFDAKGVDGVPNGSARVAQVMSRVSSWIDTYVVDLLVNLQGWIVRGGSVVLRSIQTGLVQNYALLMVLGLLVFFIVYLWPGR